MHIDLILEPATDWTGQTYEMRLMECANALRIHDLISDEQVGSIRADIRARANLARAARVEVR